MRRAQGFGVQLTWLVQAKPEPSEGGGFLVKTLTSQTIEIVEGEDQELEL